MIMDPTVAMAMFPLLLLVAGSSHANPLYSYTPYSFGYQTVDGQSRHEQGHGGVVSGSYSYTDANGDIRMVKYTADAHGFRPEGDIGVDRRTAQAAAQLVALAPKGYAAPVIPMGHWAGVPAPFKAYNSFESLMAPADIPAWNGGYGIAHTMGAPAGMASAAVHPTSYAVDTPTHKIWFKY